MTMVQDALNRAFRRSAFHAARAGVRISQHLPPLDRMLAQQAATRIARACKVISRPSASAGDPVKILVMSAFRFWSDLDLLKGQDRLELIEAPTPRFQAINAMFRTRGPWPADTRYRYFQDKDKNALAERERLYRFARLVLEELRRQTPFDAVISPSIFYEYLRPWSRACRDLGIPFIGLHKEFTLLDDVQVPISIEMYRSEETKYFGTHVLVVSEAAKALLSRAGITEAERIEVVGLPRMDRLFDPQSPWRRKQDDRPRVTLFSFAHYSGNIEPTERRSKLFSRHDHEGFVELFKEVHSAFAELAVEHPEAEFLIKPKNVVDWWNREIEQVVEQKLGRALSDIGNCRIVDANAHDLIRDSDAVVGFNSTILLEASILGRCAIVPLFAEASGKYSDNVYMRGFMDIFIPANAREAFKDALREAIAGRPPHCAGSAARRSEAYRAYLGFDDHHTTRRVVDAIERAARGAAH